MEENSRKLDLLADIKTKAEDSALNDNEKRSALLQTHLLVASSDVDTSAKPEIKLYNENRNELTNQKAAATVSRIAYNDANKLLRCHIHRAECRHGRRRRRRKLGN